MTECHGGVATVEPSSRSSHRRHTVALVGPPNCGKSTLFNRLTGLRVKVGNFPGVTVEQRLGEVRLSGNLLLNAIDLPGVYSLTPRSEDEQVTYDVLHGAQAGTEKPDAVLLILDATNLGRHLVLAAQVLSLKLPTFVVLNMADELRGGGGSLDVAVLSQRLGAPTALVSAVTGEGMETVLQFLNGLASVQLPSAPKPVELPILQDIPRCRQWASQVGTASGYHAPAPPKWTRRLDAVFLHPVAGIVIFGLVIVAVFQAIFKGAVPLMDGVENLIGASGAWLGSHLPDSLGKSLLIDGVWSGVGSVVVFLPQILMLFLFISVLEDSGYLSRAALIADRSMRRVGLQGKSFIPLLSAYACAVPAIMATRTIENKRDRFATILIAPFMTCSARLPVYTLLVAAFVEERPLLGPFLGTRAAAMLGLYLLGFLAAYGTARLLKSSVLKSERTPFMLEMPPYRWPSVRSLALRVYDRAMLFLRRAGTVILAVAVLLWVLANVPYKNGQPPKIEDSVAGQIGHAIEPAIKPLGLNWKIGIGLLTSLVAREVIVGTLGTIYSVESDEDNTEDLQAALKRDLTPAGATALLIFFAFALQCFSTVAVVRRETGGWTWPLIQFSYMLLMAYVGAWAAYHIVGAIT